MAEVILYHNGKIFTCDSELPHAEVMIVCGGRIVWVGGDAEAEDALAETAGMADAAEGMVAGVNLTRVDLRGRRVLPGFIDNHMHPVELAEYSREISILPPEITSIEELAEAIRCEWEALGGSKAPTDGSVWIQGWGFDEGKLAEHRTPNRYDLDRGSDKVPVSIVRACQHIRVLNSRALEICGIDASTPDPEGGQIDKDEKGEPTGILRENARLLAAPFMPEPDEEELADMVAGLGNLLASQGVVAIAELGSLDGSDDTGLFRKAIDKGFRQDIAVYSMWEDCRDDPDFDITPEQMAEGQQLRVCGLKILGDGTFSGHTAWMEEPYPNVGGRADGLADYGMSTCSDELLESAISFCKEHGCQLALHAMGRRTIRRFVDRLAEEEPWTDSDPASDMYIPYVRMEHVTDPAPESIAKAAEAGMAWSTQPIFLYSEIESYLANLGEEWTKRCYPVRSIIDAGLPLSLSTDSPATAWARPSDPLVNIKAAVTRIAYDGTDCNAADCDERIDVETAIRLYTAEAAKIIGIHDLGQIAPGFRASFVILDGDILEWDCGTAALDSVRVAETYIDGERVW